MSRPKSFCTINGCDQVHVGRGYCTTHYNRWRYYGDPLRSKPNTETRFWAKVRKGESCWIWVGSLNNRGYGQFRTTTHRLVLAHRFAYGLTAELGQTEQLDHRCHNRACVNPEHLRPATNKQNNENPRGLRSDNISGFRGVRWEARRNKWVGEVCHHGRRYWCGYFTDPTEANKAVIAKRNEFYTHNDADRT